MKILVCRTDRIGDFVLSLPLVDELKKKLPQAKVDVLVSKPVDKLLKFCPQIDDVIIYDKYYLKTRLRNMLDFSREIKNRNYDIAIALNPNLRLHWLLWLSRIPRRLGWKVKGGGLLLTDTLVHTKALGMMHEYRYNLLFLELLGLDPPTTRIYPRLVLDRRVDKAFSQITVGIHPHASCPSKMWPIENFKDLTIRLLEEGYGVVFVGNEEAKRIAQDIVEVIPKKYRIRVKIRAGLPLDESVYAIASCDVLVSNDSGPVHIASALNIPSVVVFGRNDPGLSPMRWKPLHPEARYIHKASCPVCLAHKCKLGFECLKAISVDEVYSELDNVLIHVRLREM